MSLKLGTGKTRTLSVCLPEELYFAAKAIADREPRESIGSYVRRCVIAAIELQRDEDAETIQP
jgi:hypothetical protein